MLHLQVGTPIHEIGHALGLLHEQSRPDRDSFVQLLLQNVQPGAENNFDKWDYVSATTYNVNYDYGSVMHYGATVRQALCLMF